MLNVTRSMRDAGEAPDARPHLLVTLLLSTAVKKGETLALHLTDIVLDDAAHPLLCVRYDVPRKRLKSRRLPLDPEVVATLPAYQRRYQPREHLFECTGRNLEYVLHTVSTLAGISPNLTFETLRWTAAVRRWREGVPEDALRQWLGLSPIAWVETRLTLHKLAQQPR